MRILIIGLGRDHHGDDDVGLLVGRHLAGQAGTDVTIMTSSADPADLIDTEGWREAGLVVLVDAMRSGAPPGTIRLFDAGREALPPLRTPHGADDLPVAEALELARVTGRLPGAVLVYAVEGASFEPGAEPSAAVRASARALAGRILEEILAGDPAAVTR